MSLVPYALTRPFLFGLDAEHAHELTLEAIAALQGYHEPGLDKVQAELTGPLRSPAGRRSYVRGVLDRAAGKVTPLTGQGSHQIATLGRANALVVVPEWVVQMSEGDTAEVLVLP